MRQISDRHFTRRFSVWLHVLVGMLMGVFLLLQVYHHWYPPLSVIEPEMLQ
jgi:hypothetical protein